MHRSVENESFITSGPGTCVIRTKILLSKPNWKKTKITRRQITQIRIFMVVNPVSSSVPNDSYITVFRHILLLTET